jgi:hypothetical protein
MGVFFNVQSRPSLLSRLWCEPHFSHQLLVSTFVQVGDIGVFPWTIMMIRVFVIAYFCGPWLPFFWGGDF